MKILLSRWLLDIANYSRWCSIIFFFLEMVNNISLLSELITMPRSLVTNKIDHQCSWGMFEGCNQQNIWESSLYELRIELPTETWLLKIKRNKNFDLIENHSRETMGQFYYSEVSLVTRVSSTMHSSLNFGLSLAENCQHLVINS